MRKLGPLLLTALLVVLIAVGFYYRFAWVNWNQDANLHPDEYGLTSTLTQLAMPESLGDYFNTRISPISPYRRYDEFGNPTFDGPDNGLRWGQWPIILLRFFAENTGNTLYGDLRLMGRSLSAFADALVVLLLYLTGRRLYGHWVGLLGAAFSALAVLQIQQSHFMTVDQFAALFAACSIYCAVRAGEYKLAVRPRPEAAYRFNPRALGWYALFGLALGMTVASRINLAPLAGMIVLAAFLASADLKLRSTQDLQRIALYTAGALALAGVVSLLTFRCTQPMTFRAPTGDTYPWTLTINPDWQHNMQLASQESAGIGGGPPQEQWAHRPRVFFPLMNMVLWGLGLPLGLAAWLGALAALIALLRWSDWRAHLIPVVWVWGYFLFMGTRWVASVRYFLPIYPWLCLLAAWGLVALYQRFTRSERGERPRLERGERPRLRPGQIAAALLAVLVLGFTFAWADAFVTAVYRTENTRVQASRWMIRNIPGPFQVRIGSGADLTGEPIPAPDVLVLSEAAYIRPFTAPASGPLHSVVLPKVASLPGDAPAQVQIQISTDLAGQEVLGETTFTVQAEQPGTYVEAAFSGGQLSEGQTYYLVARTLDRGMAQVNRPVVTNESWDEGLPVLGFGYNPFGELWYGLNMEVRWYDDENKRQMFLYNLSEADYIVLPSQRAIWSASRLPVTYPMTMEYYRALFDGRLGFELVAQFDHPLRVGPLRVSDVGGTAAWGQDPELPLFNYNLLAAEEAFSVYDHAPVWIFRKRPDFSIDQAQAILESVDLSRVVVQSPKNATWTLEE